jgi:hypothetical protein
MKKRIVLVLALLGLLLTGCKKYEDGPLISLYSKGLRVAGTWYFQKVTWGDTDSSSAYHYQKLEFIFSRKYDGGAFTWNHNVLATSQDDNPLEGGQWYFKSDKDTLQMLILKNMLKDTVVLNWGIKRLAYNEMWIERTIGDTVNLSWHLVKYVF